MTAADIKKKTYSGPVLVYRENGVAVAIKADCTKAQLIYQDNPDSVIGTYDEDALCRYIEADLNV